MRSTRAFQHRDYHRNALSWTKRFFILFVSVTIANFAMCTDLHNSSVEEDGLGFQNNNYGVLLTTSEPIQQNSSVEENDELVKETVTEEQFVEATSTVSSMDVEDIPGIQNSGLEKIEDEDTGETLEPKIEELEKVGHVKRRAIRSLMQIFGMPDDDFLLRKAEQFGPAPEFMIDLYNTITDNYGVTRARNPYGAHVIRSFMERNTTKYDFFYFNLSANGNKLRDTESVVEAELHLYRNPTPHDKLHPSLYLTPFYILSLYQVVDSRNLAIPDLHKLLGVHYVPALGSGWEVFNVTQTVMEWLKGEKENLGFIVAASSLGGDRVPVIFSRRSITREGEKSNKQPILVLFNHDTEVKRLNRMTSTNPEYRMSSRQQEKGKSLEKQDDDNDQDNSAPVLPNIPNSSLENPRFHHSLLYQDTIRHPNSVSRFRSRRSKNQTEHSATNQPTADQHPHANNLTSCSKHDLFINFEAIGWSSWIISPKGYNAYSCKGPCVFPLNHEVSPTNHATLQSIAHELNLSPDVGRPCCVPTKLLPISLLYYDDDDNVVLKQYVDMVADTCGCH